MARSVYVAGLGPGVGKGTVALGLVELLSRQVARIGVFRPLVNGSEEDPLLTLLTKRYPLVAPYEDHIAVASPLAQVHLARGEPALATAVLQRAIRMRAGDVLCAGPLLALLVGDPQETVANFPVHGVVALVTDDEGETWKEEWRIL